MWILEEAGGETELTIAATLRSAGVYDEGSFQEALHGLERLGWIRHENDDWVMTRLGYDALSK